MTRLEGVKQGDVGQQLIVRLWVEIDDVRSPAPLGDVTTIVTRVRRGRYTATLNTTVTDADEGIITIECDGWLNTLTKPGRWFVEYEATYTDGSKKTWPNEGYDTIEVDRQLDATN